MTPLGLVGDLDDHKKSSVQYFRPLGAEEAPNSLTGLGSEGGRDISVLSRVPSQVKKELLSQKFVSQNVGSKMFSQKSNQ